MKVLIVEDEPSLSGTMREWLQREGHVVETACSYAAADDKLAGYTYDCVLLDIMLPDGNGLKLLERIKGEERNENVIIISARGDMEDKVAGLDLGADDYLPKPFHLAELSARIRSVARRSRAGGRKGFTVGNVHIEPETGRVEVGGTPLGLVRKEFDILLYFMLRPRHMVDKVALAEAVWGDHADQTDDFAFLYTQMRNLRRKLENAGATVRIESVYGYGYKMEVGES